MENKHGTRKKEVSILDGILKGSIDTVVNNQPTTELSELDKSIAVEQMDNHYNKAMEVFKLYKDNKTLKGNEEFLNSDRLENYKLVVSGTQISIVDKYDTSFKYGYFSLGNAKLKNDEYTTFLIWNIIQKTSCKYKTVKCGNDCYANKAWNSWNRNVLSRCKNLILSTYSNFEDIFKEVIELVNKIYGSTRIRIRIHESGDFYSIPYYNKIAKVLNNNIHENLSLAYTKNIELLPLLKENKKCFNVRFSIMEDTPKHIQELALKHNCNYFVVMDDIQNYTMLPSCNSSCTKCDMCHNSDILTIVCKTH